MISLFPISGTWRRSGHFQELEFTGLSGKKKISLLFFPTEHYRAFLQIEYLREKIAQLQHSPPFVAFLTRQQESIRSSLLPGW